MLDAIADEIGRLLDEGVVAEAEDVDTACCSAPASRSSSAGSRLTWRNAVPLFEPELFEPLTDEAWDEARVRRAIEEIVAGADAAYDDRRPLAGRRRVGQLGLAAAAKTLYTGAAGVVWALRELGRRGHASSGLDLADASRRVLEAWRAEPVVLATVEVPSRRTRACSSAKPASSSSPG